MHRQVRVVPLLPESPPGRRWPHSAPRRAGLARARAGMCRARQGDGCRQPHASGGGRRESPPAGGGGPHGVTRLRPKRGSRAWEMRGSVGTGLRSATRRHAPGTTGHDGTSHHATPRPAPRPAPRCATMFPCPVSRDTMLHCVTRCHARHTVPFCSALQCITHGDHACSSPRTPPGWRLGTFPGPAQWGAGSSRLSPGPARGHSPPGSSSLP